MAWYVWVGILVGLIVSWWVAGELQSIARDKGYEGKEYFWLPFLFGPAGWAIVIALPDKKMNETLTSIASLLERYCEKQNPQEKKQEPQQPPKVNREERKTERHDTQSEGVLPLPGQKENTIVCPKCGEVQNAGRNVCWSCGIRFANFDD